jgi:hypothetical protein
MTLKRSRIALSVILEYSVYTFLLCAILTLRHSIDLDTGGEGSANLTPISEHVLLMQVVKNFSG